MKVKPTNHPGEVTLKVGRRDEPLLEASSNAPFRFKNILVPIDFSDCSKKALAYALPLAIKHGATLTLLLVVPIPAYAAGEFTGVDYSVTTTARTSGEKELDDLVAHVVHGKVPADALVRNGSPAVEIVNLARELPADIIVISTHGRSGLKHAVLGSVTEHVVRYAPCPVLVVRESEHECLAG